MLEGTDLYSAYGPLTPQFEEIQQQVAPSVSNKTPSPTKPTPQPAPQEVAAPTPLYDASAYNSQYSKEQQLLTIINEMKKRQGSANAQSGESYFDKLVARKKEVFKFIHSALIIVFALAIHFLVSHYFDHYLKHNDVSFEREIILRVLYPISIIFIAWNIMLIFK